MIHVNGYHHYCRGCLVLGDIIFSTMWGYHDTHEGGGGGGYHEYYEGVQ